LAGSILVYEKSMTPKNKRPWLPIFVREESLWSAWSVFLSLIVIMPLLAVVWIALTPSENIWPHLLATTLPRYLANTLIMMFSVGLLSAFIGTVAAWLVTMYDFPLRRVLQWALFLPLAVPAYVGAFALVDFLEYAGPVQQGLRAVFGWSSAQDYWFPEIRSRGAAIIVLTASLFPYVYLLARAAFREVSGVSFEVARTLGASPLQRFVKVGLPLARPAIAAGATICMMETVNDFGTVDFYAVQTLTTGIFTVWLEQNNAGGAAQIAIVVLTLILVLVGLERSGRSKARTFRQSRMDRPVERTLMQGRRRWMATVFCLVPFLVGFVLPIAVLVSISSASPEAWSDPRLLKATWNTVRIGAIASLVTVGGAVMLVYGVRLGRGRLGRRLLPVTSIGYAAPGAVLGIGVLIPLGVLDHQLADGILAVTGSDPGLLLTGTGFALVYAYMVRFFTIGQGAADAAMARVAPSLPMAARSLGRSARGTLSAVYLPMIKGSIGTALLLVFVDCVKELPATLLLRPFNFDTLATRVYEKASLENLTDATPPALLISLVGLAAVALLAKSNR
jgi:iron(III) transport system permease protein